MIITKDMVGMELLLDESSVIAKGINIKRTKLHLLDIGYSDKKVLVQKLDGFSTAYPSHPDFGSDCCGFFVPTDDGVLKCNECGITINFAIEAMYKDIRCNMPSECENYDTSYCHKECMEKSQ